VLSQSGDKSSIRIPNPSIAIIRSSCKETSVNIPVQWCYIFIWRNLTNGVGVIIKYAPVTHKLYVKREEEMYWIVYLRSTFLNTMTKYKLIWSGSWICTVHIPDTGCGIPRTRRTEFYIKFKELQSNHCWVAWFFTLKPRDPLLDSKHKWILRTHDPSRQWPSWVKFQCQCPLAQPSPPDFHQLNENKISKWFIQQSNGRQANRLDSKLSPLLFRSVGMKARRPDCLAFPQLYQCGWSWTS